MATKSKSKTRMSAVIDHSNMGLAVGADGREDKSYSFMDVGRVSSQSLDMEVSKLTSKKLRKAFAQAIGDGKRKHNAYFTLRSGDMKSGNYTVLLNFVNRNMTENVIQFEFKQSDKRCFLNVSGNPTSLVAGTNDIPILIVGFAYGKYKPAAITFKYLNRVMYAVLDDLLEPYGFKWEGDDKKRLVRGDISIQTYQIAWYSGDLGGKRNDALRYIRSIYGGLNATASYVENAAKGLNLNARIWDNHQGNITIEAKSGDRNRSFSITLYAKDEHPDKISEDNDERLNQLIRWDCTLNNAFLAANKIKKIHELEEKYIEVCEADGYDIGFVRYISEKIYSRLKIRYLMTINRDSYRRIVDYAQSGNLKKHEKLLADYWLTHDNVPFTRDTDGADYFKIKRERYNEAKKSLLANGLDIEMSRSAYEAILKNRADSTMTAEERGDYYLNKIGDKSNKALKFNDLIERDTKNSEKFISAVGSIQGAVLKIRKFKPIKVTPEKFWVLKPIEDFSKGNVARWK